jgi:predicted transposase YbfD/YdcC
VAVLVPTICVVDLFRIVLELRGATVTIDAMGCQREIAETILAGGGDYLLAVKDNQPTLHQDLQTTFDEAADARQRTVDEQSRPTVEVTQNVEKGHGRVETRTVTLCRDLSWVTLGVANTRKRAGWDRGYLIKLLTNV